MKKKAKIYRKNFSLIIVLLIITSCFFIVALVVSYNLTGKYVESEFYSKKIEVLDQTIKPYNDFFRNRVPEITSYQGFIGTESASKYTEEVFADFPFVNRILFYDLLIGNTKGRIKQKSHLGVLVKAAYQFKRDEQDIRPKQALSTYDKTDFNLMSLKLLKYINRIDTLHTSSSGEIFNTFYDVKPNKISYTNVLSREDVKVFKEIGKDVGNTAFSKQSMFTFFLDANMVKVNNVHPELYQNISVQPVVYDQLDNNSDMLITEVPLPAAFSEFKLYFKSAKLYLNAEVNRRYIPICVILVVFYIFLLIIGWLIYRNLNVNIKLFKLQYDFINNFTHEFKTPVSVIKIAGSNLSGDNELSEKQRKKYGRILNEEADKLNDLMSKLLSFTQLENKSISIKKEEINLEDFAIRYVETFKLKYPDFEIGLKVINVKLFIIDPILLGSIFQNLMENAYKYSHPYRRELDIKIVGEKKNVVLTFADKGIGIQKSELGNIFKKFYRVENQYNQNGSVGLGLAFCKELVTFIGGEINVDSKPNEGSTFIVVLPYLT
jgi:two-component system phosphate regulon sensor histidine kinase PhoR